MNQPVALALQAEPVSDSSMWVIIAVVLVILFFIVVIIGVGLTIFFIARKRGKAQRQAAIASAPYSAPALSEPEVAPVVPPVEAAPPAAEPVGSMPVHETSDREIETADFDPTRTVAIVREETVEVSYGTIKFVSGVLADQQFEVKAEGEYIGREPSLATIVVSDPRISKRHLWIGVRDGVVKIEDQNSRNGTFLNDPRSERVTEAALTSGDTVILGESDVARFEYKEPS